MNSSCWMNCCLLVNLYLVLWSKILLSIMQLQHIVCLSKFFSLCIWFLTEFYDVGWHVFLCIYLTWGLKDFLNLWLDVFVKFTVIISSNITQFLSCLPPFEILIPYAENSINRPNRRLDTDREIRQWKLSRVKYREKGWKVVQKSIYWVLNLWYQF